MNRFTLILIIFFLINTSCSKKAKVDIVGNLQVWNPIILTFEGPESSETGKKNPFLNYRLDVTFSKGDKQIVVPGYWAADGNAAKTSATSGNKWRVYFVPSEAGVWSYNVSFRKGKYISVSGEKGWGAGYCNGTKGELSITEDALNSKVLNKGMLKYVNSNYPRYSANNEIFIKIGVDSPENFLAYSDFDDTPNIFKFRKSWAPHSADYKGEANHLLWGQNGDKGKNIFGVIDYLASQGLNAISFLTFNVDGDDRNVYPYLLKVPVSEYEKYASVKNNKSGFHDLFESVRFDVSKMEQWERFFTYADQKGFFLHFKTFEVENESTLDFANLNIERRLYYRELIARYAHHSAMNWNLGEETTLPKELLTETIDYIQMLDPYKHLVVMHTYPKMGDKRYSTMIGDSSNLTGVSYQTRELNFGDVHHAVVKWVKTSAQKGKPWVVSVDEPGNSGDGLVPDNVGFEHDSARVNVIWGTLLGGGYGIEWYFGYKHPNSDLTCQDYSTRTNVWKQSKIAKDFFQSKIKLDSMKSSDELVTGNNFCLAQSGEQYVVMLKKGGAEKINLSSTSGKFIQQWFNPRTGEIIDVKNSISGGGWIEIGMPPYERNRDWVALLKKI